MSRKKIGEDPGKSTQGKWVFPWTPRDYNVSPLVQALERLTHERESRYEKFPLQLKA